VSQSACVFSFSLRRLSFNVSVIIWHLEIITEYYFTETKLRNKETITAGCTAHFFESC
jgi:hypothetical protein